jgi:hypothetical protein
VTRGLLNPDHNGPFFFMPRLNLDNFLATAGGLLWWGFAKQLAHITVTRNRYSVAERDSGAPLISLDFEPTGDYQPLPRLPHLEPVRRMLDQPILSQLPLGIGPYFVWSDFDKHWPTARVRPLSTVVTISQEFVQGLPNGRYPAEGRCQGIDQLVLGSYEIRTQWRQGLIHPSAFQFGWPLAPQRAHGRPACYGHSG